MAPGYVIDIDAVEAGGDAALCRGTRPEWSLIVGIFCAGENGKPFI